MRKTIRGTSQELEEAARSMRRQPTHAEEVLWAALQKKQVAGLKFRRQHPVGRFVQVDGEVHDAQQESDAERTRSLETHGYRVIRFQNDEVLRDLPSVIHRIAAVAAESA